MKQKFRSSYVHMYTERTCWFSRWDGRNFIVSTIASLLVLLQDNALTFTNGLCAKTCMYVDFDQGDRIGRIFAYWAIVYFAHFLKITHAAQI
jgi:hypothetical protein